MNDPTNIRNLYLSDEFLEYYHDLTPKDYAKQIKIAERILGGLIDDKD